ncbi:MAG: hypothetical protein ACRD1Z_03040, partial [Vicinamibacteria bacterium]
GWHAVGLGFEDLRKKLDRLRPLVEAEGRQMERFTISLRARLNVFDGPAGTPPGERRPLSGTVDEVAEDIRAYADLGVKHLVFDIFPVDRRNIFDQLKLFTKKVRTLAGPPPAPKK